MAEEMVVEKMDMAAQPNNARGAKVRAANIPRPIAVAENADKKFEGAIAKDMDVAGDHANGQGVPANFKKKNTNYPIAPRECFPLLVLI